jgi:hypothetical protein
MRLTKQASKRKRRKDVVPALGAVGVSLSLAGGGSASAAVADLPQKDAATSPEIILSEEEISDVNLGTFYVFDKETAGTPRLGEKFARACGGCGGGRGCGRGCRGCRGCGGGGCGGCGGCSCGCCLSWGACRIC